MDSLCGTPGDARSPTSFLEEPKPVLGALLAGEMVGSSPEAFPRTSDDTREESSVLTVWSSLQALVRRGAQLPAVPKGPVRVVEYGSVNGRAFPLLSALLGTLAEALAFLPHPDPSPPPAFEEQQTDLIVLHIDAPGTDFRPLMSALETAPASYLSPSFQDAYPSAKPFPYFTTRTFGQPVCPRASVDLGISLMDLHWSHPAAAFPPPNPTSSPDLTSPASTSTLPPLDPEDPERELSLFLLARAQELRPGGTLILAYIARDERTSLLTSSLLNSPSLARTAEGDDVWSVLSSLLAPSIQRLVSCGMLKADVARYMLTLPLYPRSAEQSVTVLREQEGLWTVEWACGLGE